MRRGGDLDEGRSAEETAEAETVAGLHEGAGPIRAIYRAPTEPAGLAALEAFAASPVGTKYPAIATLWRRHWPHVAPVFAYPPEMRRLLYTTNAIESLHMQLRKIVKTRGHFPTDEAATKLLYLAMLFGSRFTDHN